MLAAPLRRIATMEHARIAPAPSILSAVLIPGINLAVWTREGTAQAIHSLDLSTVDDVALVSPVAASRDAVRAALTGAGYDETTASSLATDIAALARTLADIVERDTVAIRLEVIETDACRRFHADYVTARLICTYVGPATQWLADADAAALRDGTDLDQLSIRQLGTGDVAIFKGREWSPDRPIVHRSPPIVDTGQQRLVLVVDPAPDAPISHA